MKFLEVTNDAGLSIYINMDKIVSINKNYHKPTTTIINVEGREEGITAQEDLKKVLNAIGCQTSKAI